MICHGGMDCFVSRFYRPPQQRFRFGAIYFHEVWTGRSRSRAKRRHWYRQKLERRPRARLR